MLIRYYSRFIWFDFMYFFYFVYFVLAYFCQVKIIYYHLFVSSLSSEEEYTKCHQNVCCINGDSNHVELGIFLLDARQKC